MSKIYQMVESSFGNRGFIRKMLKIAMPIIIQNFIASFLNMLDTVMVGKLGETEIAAVGIANQYFFFFNMFMIGLGAGCGVFVSQFWGKKDLTNIKRILGIGLGSSLIISLGFMVFGWFMPNRIMALFNNDPQVIALGAGYLRVIIISYLFTGITFLYNFALRSIGKSFQPMLISVLALLCNAFFNYVFIFGKFGAPVLGVEGAALATVIARVLETVVLVVSIYAGKGDLAASGRELLDLSFGFIGKAYRVICPVVLNDICWGLASLVYAAVYGRMGTQAVATIQICNTVNNLFLVVIFGMSSAAAVMVGNSIGAGAVSEGKDYAKKFSVLSVGWGLILGILLAVVAPNILNIFNVSTNVRQDALILLWIISGVFFIRVFSIILIVGILRGGGDAKYAFLLEGCTMWFIGVPLTIFGAFVLKLPVYQVYALAILEEVAKCIFGVMRLKSGSWVKNVTANLT